MNQNPFAFFSADPNGYAPLPDPLGNNPYLDARSGMLLKDDSLHTSSMSQASHETDSNPSTPSKSKKSERRTPKSKAEVSERMRRWRAENAEKNRLNDLRCRVYRQARLRFGKDPTPEREAWIQSEIFRRLERRRLREAMKGNNGSCPAPTAIASPASVAMGLGGHTAGGPITRSRSTVHPFPIHMASSAGVPDHAMGFPATPYAMMMGNGTHESQQHSQQQQHHHHQQQHHHQQHHHQGQQQMHYGHHQQLSHQQQQQHQAQQQSHFPQPHQYQHNQQQDAHHHQLSHNFIAGASAALPHTDIYGGFKFINPLYQGRLLSPQTNASQQAAQSLYPTHQHQHQQHVDQQQHQHQQQQHHHGQQQQQQAQQQAGANFAGTNGVSAHTVPSQVNPSSAVAAAAVAAAAAAVADLSNPFQLPSANGTGMYGYYSESLPPWEASNGSTELSNGQSHSSPSTPVDNTVVSQAQYTLHAVDNPVYPIDSVSGSAGPSATSSSSMTPASIINQPIATPSSVALLDPSSVSVDTDSASILTDVKRDGSANSADAVSSSHGSTSSDLTAVVSQQASSSYLYGFQHESAGSPSLNDVASNLFSLRQMSGNNSQEATSLDEQRSEAAEKHSSFDEVSPVDRLAAVAAAAASASQDPPQMKQDGVISPNPAELMQQSQEQQNVQQQQEQQQESQADAHRLRHNLLQGSFNLGVVPDNVNFSNY